MNVHKVWIYTRTEITIKKGLNEVNITPRSDPWVEMKLLELTVAKSRWLPPSFPRSFLPMPEGTVERKGEKGGIFGPVSLARSLSPFTAGGLLRACV